MTPDAEGRPRRPGGSRDELLDAGLEMLREFPIAKILRFLTAREVSKRIGMTTGVFYHHFPTQQEYCDALLARLLDPAVSDSMVPSAEEYEGIVREPGTTDYHATIEALALNHQRVMATPAQRLHVWLSARRGADPALDEVLAVHHEWFDDTYAVFVEDHLARRGRKMAPPYDAKDLAFMFNALADGLSLRDAGGADRVATLYASILAVVVEGFSVDADSDETYEDVVARLSARIAPSAAKVRAVD